MKILFLLFIFISVSTSLPAQKNPLSHYKIYFDKELKGWTGSFENFNLRNFKVSEEIKFEGLAYGDINDLKDFYSIYKPLLSFSSDSNRFIDIYSYWLNLEKKGNKITANAGIDQAISLCDLKTDRWTRIFFCGSSTRIDEALWVNDVNFILAGTFLDEKNTFHPEVLIGNLVKNTLTVYTDSEAVATKSGYISPKLKKLTIYDQ